MEEGDEDEQFKAVMDEAKQAMQVSHKTNHKTRMSVPTLLEVLVWNLN